MVSRDSSPLERFREPEYTGENRCTPCTVLNAALALVLTAVAGAFGPVAALAVFVGSFASIYFRGYLVPGTPELTKRYLPDRVLALFGKTPDGPREGWEGGAPVTVTDETAAISSKSGRARSTDAVGTDTTSGGETTGAPGGEAVGTVDDEAGETDDGTAGEADDETAGETDDGTAGETNDETADEPEFETVKRIQNRRENSVEPVEFLLDVGVVEQTDGVEELTFEPAFAERVESLVSSLERDDVDAETFATMFGVDPEDVSFHDRSYPAVTVRRRVRKWPGDGAYLSDVASHLALVDRTDRWLDVPAEQRLSILQSLRSFHSSCPVCGGEVAATADTVESCCLAHEVVAIRCADCGEHILELDPDAVATPGEDTGVTP